MKPKKVDPVAQAKKRLILVCTITSFVIIASFILLLVPGLEWVDILIRLVFSGIPLYFTWFHSSKPPLPGQILSSLMIFLLWLPFLISSAQILLLVDSIVFLIFIGYLLYLLLKKKKHFVILTSEALLLGVWLFLSMFDYTFARSPEIHFWEVGLVVSILAAAVAIVLLATEKIVLKDNRFSERLSLPILVFFGAFVIVWTISCHLNYALDTKEPAEYMAVIVEKEVDKGHRSPEVYIFTLELNDELIELAVSQSAYYEYEIGETFPVLLYQGTFNDPFYIEGSTQS